MSASTSPCPRRTSKVWRRSGRRSISCCRRPAPRHERDERRVDGAAPWADAREGAAEGAMNTLTDHRGRPRVVVTGIGLKTPAGNDVDTFWSRLLAGVSAAAPIRNIAAGGLPVRFACEVPDFDQAPYSGPKGARRLDRVTHLGLAAAVAA